MIFFDCEIAKLPHIHSDEYESMRDKQKNFDFMPEYNNTICISYISSSDWQMHSLVGDEKEMLESFLKIINGETLCGYNIKNFDLPFLIKRSVILGIKIPNSLKAYRVKPWNLEFIDDLMECWRHFGNTACNLDTLCGALDIPTPKDKMDGSEVDTYYRAGRIDEIKEYCERDTITCVKVWKRFVETNLI